MCFVIPFASSGSRNPLSSFNYTPLDKHLDVSDYAVFSVDDFHWGITLRALQRRRAHVKGGIVCVFEASFIPTLIALYYSFALCDHESRACHDCISSEDLKPEPNLLGIEEGQLS